MAGWPTASERRELGAYPAQAGPEDVKGFFELSPDDLAFVLSHHRDAQLGVAVALCSLRWLGFVPDDLGELPRPALLALCEQLEADPDDVIVYGTRSQTRSDHFLVIRDRAGFRAFDAAQRERLEEWLISRAMEHERPKALHALACEQLRSIKVVRPGVDALVRMISAARDRAHAAAFDELGDQLKSIAESAANGDLSYSLDTVRGLTPRITRIYTYHWMAPGPPRMGSRTKTPLCCADQR